LRKKKGFDNSVLLRRRGRKTYPFRIRKKKSTLDLAFMDPKKMGGGVGAHLTRKGGGGKFPLSPRGVGPHAEGHGSGKGGAYALNPGKGRGKKGGSLSSRARD